jgi:glucose-6-phosphate dehydrogenase assembly protein OpcA
MVKPEQILKELSKLWIDLGHEQKEDTPHGETAAGVLRACAMTLVTIADESEDPSNLGETVAMLMKEHPSRSVLIRLRPSGDEVLESRVFAQCWMPFGQRRQICCEQIEITASLSNLDDVPGVVLPLSVPDLPVIVWCRSPRLFDSPSFPRFAAVADKVIADSGAFAEPSTALEVLDRHSKSGRLLADLAWTRTTRWRETLSRVFVNRECLDSLPTASVARVEFGTNHSRTEAVYLAAWLENGIRRAGGTASVELRKTQGPAVAALSIGQGDCEISLRCDEHGVVDVKARGAESRVVFPEATDYLSLREELSITTRDPIFDAALTTALRIIHA